jgi:hypothetical protein
MSASTMLHKQHRMKKCEVHKATKTVKHHLLLDKPGERAKQRVIAKSKDNIYIFKGKRIESEEDRKKALNYIESLFSNDNEKFDLNAFRKVKHKLKKWIASDKTSPKEVELFTKILSATNDKKQGAIKKEGALMFLSGLGKVSRFNDKKKAIELLCDLHNKRRKLNIDQGSQLNCALVDVLFKIPHHNKTELTGEEQLKILVSYYRKNFPAFPVVLAVCHKDEIGDHPHIMLDAKNEVTGAYDYVQSQYEFAKSKFNLDSSYPPLNSELDESQLKTVGELLQTDFYDYINQKQKKHVFKLKEYITPEHKKLEREKISLDTSKPIADREYNTATYLREQKQVVERALTPLIADTEKLKNENSSLQNDNLSLELRSNDLTNEVGRLESTVDALSRKIKSLVQDAINHATHYATTILESSISPFKERMREIHSIDIDTAKETLKQAVTLQPTVEQKVKIKDSYQDAVSNRPRR